MEDYHPNNILRKQRNWNTLHFYQKTQVLYQLTLDFTARYLKRGDRTIDQMVQAARSGKQNIVEGMADGVTSSDGNKTAECEQSHPRYEQMCKFCRHHNKLEDYQRYFAIWSDEELANVALSLCHFTDKMMTSYEKRLEKEFVENGGIKERMTAARLGYRTNQREEIQRLQEEIRRLKQELAALKGRD